MFHRDRLERTDEDFEAAARVFMADINPSKNQIVAGYWPAGREFDVRFILDDCLKAGIVCALPIIQKDSRELKFARWDETIPLSEGPFGIMEPAGADFVLPDIVLTPMLAFDRKGHRLGYGKGYYDATIEALRAQKDILAIGVGYAEQAVLFNLPAESHDQPLDVVLTPQGLQDFRKEG